MIGGRSGRGSRRFAKTGHCHKDANLVLLKRIGGAQGYLLYIPVYFLFMFLGTKPGIPWFFENRQLCVTQKAIVLFSAHCVDVLALRASLLGATGALGFALEL